MQIIPTMLLVALSAPFAEEPASFALREALRVAGAYAIVRPNRGNLVKTLTAYCWGTFLVGLVWLTPVGLRADWAPSPDCRARGVDCDDADAAVIEREERKHFCSCNPDKGGGEAEDEGCSCSAPGRAHSQRLGIGAFALSCAAFAVWFERRRGRP